MGPENGQNIADLIAQQATAEPDKIALIDGERRLSFTQLNQQQGQWAQLFSTSDFVAGDRVGLCLRDSADFVVALLGAAQAGLTIMPMDFRAPLAARADLASRFSLAGLVTEPGSPTPDNVRCLQLDGPLQARLRESSPPIGRTADQALLFIKLSSGTTGLPKGALITHDQFIFRMQRHRQRYGNFRNGRYLSATPLHFTGGHSHVLFQLMNGNTVILYPPLFAAEELIDAVREHAATILFLVPTVLRWLVDQPANDALLFPNLKSLTTSAGPMTGEEKRQAAHRLSPRLYQGYATSAAGQISCLLPEDLAEHAESVGRPHADLDVEIIDLEGQAVPPGVTGVLRCRGQAVATAYFHAADDGDAAERFEDGWCYTGDLASLDDDGYLYIRGRADDLIIRGGANIHPESVEAEIQLLPGVRDVAVVGRQDAELGQVPVAFVVTQGEIGIAELITHCVRKLPGFMVPAEFFLVENLPRSVTGKLQRRVLRQGLSD